MKKVMAFGTFDGVHPGHINFLKQAKLLGDWLVVVVGRDKTVFEVKGKIPRYNEEFRVSAIKKISGVDEALLGGLGNKFEIIEHEKPDIIALGYDQTFFVDTLRKKFSDSIRIVRLQPYFPDIYKSSKLASVE